MPLPRTRLLDDALGLAALDDAILTRFTISGHQAMTDDSRGIGLPRRGFMTSAALAGAGAHAPDEYYLVESTNPKVAGITDATLGYVDMFYQVASVS